MVEDLNLLCGKLSGPIRNLLGRRKLASGILMIEFYKLFPVFTIRKFAKRKLSFRPTMSKEPAAIQRHDSTPIRSWTDLLGICELGNSDGDGEE
jgi:hypothetical protein